MLRLCYTASFINPPARTISSLDDLQTRCIAHAKQLSHWLLPPHCHVADGKAQKGTKDRRNQQAVSAASVADKGVMGNLSGGSEAASVGQRDSSQDARGGESWKKAKQPLARLLPC